LMNMFDYIKNIVCVSELNNVSVDIFLSDTMQKYSLDLNPFPLRSNVYFFPEQIHGRLHKIKKYICLGSELKKDLNQHDLKKYDWIIGTGYNNFFIRLCNYNRNAEVILLEDGIGTYMNEQRHQYQKSIFYKMIEPLHRGPLALEFTKLYCYHPEIMCIQNKFPIYTLPFLNDSDFCTLKKIFSYLDTEQYYQDRIIYFTSDYTWEVQYSFHEFNLLDMLCDYKEQVIIRFHPHRLNRSYQDYKVDTSNQFWELQCRDISENHILIGIFSTAQFSPYLFYGKHYNIIFLYKLVFPTDSYLYQQCEKTVGIMKKDFPDIYVPESREEFHSVMEKLISNK